METGVVTRGDFRDFLGGGGGGGGGYAAPQWRPGEYELEQAVQRLNEQKFGLDEEISRAQLELDQYTSRGQLDLARQTEARIGRMEQQRINLDRQIADQTAALQQQRIGVDIYGIDAQQRRDDINAQLDQLGLEYQDAWNLRQDAMQRGDQALQQDAENRMRYAAESANQLQEQAQQIDVRGQDIGAQLDQLGLQYQDLWNQRQDAIQRGDLQLQADAEERMRYAAESANQLQQRGQDITARGQDIQGQIAQNDQLIDLYSQQVQAARAQGDFQLAAAAEERLRGAQQQDVALRQHAAELEGVGLGIEAGRGAGNIQTQLAQIEQQRQSELAQLAANPRDWLQMQYAMGGGESFMNQLLSGAPMTGQSALGGAGVPSLGAGFESLVGMLGQRPAFEAAMGTAGRLGETAIPGAPGLDFLLGLGELPPIGAPPQFPGAPTLGDIGAPPVPGLQFPGMAPPGFTMPEPVQGQPPPLELPPAPGPIQFPEMPGTTYTPPGPPAPAPPPPQLPPPLQAPAPGTSPFFPEVPGVTPGAPPSAPQPAPQPAPYSPRMEVPAVPRPGKPPRPPRDIKPGMVGWKKPDGTTVYLPKGVIPPWVPKKK